MQGCVKVQWFHIERHLSLIQQEIEEELHYSHMILYHDIV